MSQTSTGMQGLCDGGQGSALAGRLEKRLHAAMQIYTGMLQRLLRNGMLCMLAGMTARHVPTAAAQASEVRM